MLLFLAIYSILSKPFLMLPRVLQAFPIFKADNLRSYRCPLGKNDSVSHELWLVLKFSELPGFLPECGYEIADVV